MRAEIGKWWVGVLSMAVVAMALAFTVGCEGDGGGDSGGGGNVVGSWELREGGTGGPTQWGFESDGTFAWYNDAAHTSRKLGGTYKQDGAHVTGDFSNPGVGTGEIDCTISDDGKTMQMDFIEHWHTPYKHVPMSGTKL
ncbi:MAG: hypothetical protein K8T26_09870 [Lentisphaerae bacterium]|nr:hypothetical protein [Lentisphaerota bacterium]